MRILYLHGTFVPPPQNPAFDRFYWLSAELEGDVLQEVWFHTPDEVDQHLGRGSYPVFNTGRFRYHFLLGSNTRSLRSRISLAWFFLSKGLQIYRERPFDCVVTYSHTLTALCGIVLKLLTRAKLIVEIVIAPNTAYSSQDTRFSLIRMIMQWYSNLCVHICILFSDRVHALAPSLLGSYRGFRNIPTSVFFEGVPISRVPAHTCNDEFYILLVGAPWHRKGVDLLIAAFRRFAQEFPHVKLRLLGYYPDTGALDAMIQGCPQIEVLKPRSNPEVLEIISKATIFALPSRCEGVPRVILEAMAAGLPVVASNVDGIPCLVRDGENGFLVPSEDVNALEACLRKLIVDPELRRAMGAKGYEMAHTEFSEQAYAREFTQMVALTLGNSTIHSAGQAAGR